MSANYTTLAESNRARINLVQTGWGGLFIEIFDKEQKEEVWSEQIKAYGSKTEVERIEHLLESLSPDWLQFSLRGLEQRCALVRQELEKLEQKIGEQKCSPSKP